MFPGCIQSITVCNPVTTMSALTAVRSSEYDWLVTEPVRESRPLVTWSAPGDGLSETRWRLELVPVPGYAEQNTQAHRSQSAANQRPVLWAADQWEGGTAAGSDVTCLAECVSVHSLAPLTAISCLSSQMSATKNWPKRRVGQFYLYVYPNLSWIPAKIRENVRGFIWKFLKLLDKPGPLPWLSSRFIISIKLTTTHFNNLVKTPASMARIENAKLTTFKIIQLEAR